MMQLHELRTRIGRKKKRVGRGGKRGTYSGRGLKGQKSRAGHRIRPASRDLILRIPKRRGFKNKPKSDTVVVVSLEAVSRAISRRSGVSVIDKNTLREMRLIPGRTTAGVKILGQGEIKTPLVFRGLRVSESAKAKIVEAGGKIE